MSTIRVGEIFRDAVRQTCPSLIVIHNHPSGDPTPSSDDIAVTKQIINAGELLDIEVLDHIVIGHGRFISLKEQRLAFD
jgi:DNA repair protein RadC